MEEMSKEMPARGKQLFLANNELCNRLEHCTNLPSPPGVATRIIELSLDPNVSLNDVAAAVRVDPALTTKNFTDSKLCFLRTAAQDR